MRAIGMGCLASAMFACTTTHPETPPLPFSQTSIVEHVVLTGPEGISIQVVQSDTHALVETTRVHPTIDGAVVLADLTGDAADRGYATKIDGRKVQLLSRTDRAWKLVYQGPIRLDVDVAASKALNARTLMTRHQAQQAEGRLQSIQDFDRAASEQRMLEKLEKTMSRIDSACGFEPKISVDFTGFSDELLMRGWATSRCGILERPIVRACAVPELKAYLAQTAQAISCRVGPHPGIAITHEAIQLTTSTTAKNLEQWARDALDDHVFDEPRTVYQSRMQHDTVVCAAPTNQTFVVIGPNENERTQGIAYGRQDKLLRLKYHPLIGREWFFEPRYPDPSRREFRGYDLRFYSYVDISPKHPCTLRCGTHTLQLRSVVGSERHRFLDAAQWKAVPVTRRPYALARDKRGIYYYVDQASQPEGNRDFQLYIGPQGNLKRQKMRDIVSDSEGEIFASRNGKLKLFLNRNSAEWQRQRRVRRLLRLDIQENVDLIYNRLGIYLGKPLFTPCDLI